MEQPKEPFHLRPFPQQPHRGGKELNTILDQLETALGANSTDVATFRTLQERLHQTASRFNDDTLIDLLRTISHEMDQMCKHPSDQLSQQLAQNILKIRICLKRL